MKTNIKTLQSATNYIYIYCYREENYPAYVQSQIQDLTSCPSARALPNRHQRLQTSRASVHHKETTSAPAASELRRRTDSPKCTKERRKNLACTMKSLSKPILSIKTQLDIERIP